MADNTISNDTVGQVVHVPIGRVRLEGALSIPQRARAIVIFAHGSGSSRHSPRNTYVARLLRRAGLGTMLLDLLTEGEDATYATRFDIGLLTERLERTTSWLRQQPQTRAFDLGYFGASTGAAAALDAAAAPGNVIDAIVSRGGRPDLARRLDRVTAPTLLIVGGLDYEVLDLNRRAYHRLTCEKDLRVVEGATHLFEEAGALDEVARLATSWFVSHFQAMRSIAPSLVP